MSEKYRYLPLLLGLLVSFTFATANVAKPVAASAPAAQKADYVIIGAGTAGSALATRLSEKYSVIVLEGGFDHDDDPLISDPANSGVLVNTYTNKFFWGLGHTPLAPPPNQKRWPGVAGQLLGGSSSVNGMQFVRSTVSSFN